MTTDLIGSVGNMLVGSLWYIFANPRKISLWSKNVWTSISGPKLSFCCVFSPTYSNYFQNEGFDPVNIIFSFFFIYFLDFMI